MADAPLISTASRPKRAHAKRCRPALLVVDVQEDFCPPNGSLAVKGGRDIVGHINRLLDMKVWKLKIATKDYHPPDHISFASNHPGPDNTPFKSTITIKNPLNPKESQETRLWPVHCVQGTKGSELVSELDAGKFDVVVEKGQDRRVEMYSAFADPFTSPCVAQSGLKDILQKAGITDVYIAGLAADYCVKYTALDAAKNGFRTVVVDDATRAVDPDSMELVYKEYAEAGILVAGRDMKELESSSEEDEGLDTVAETAT